MKLRMFASVCITTLSLLAPPSAVDAAPKVEKTEPGLSLKSTAVDLLPVEKGYASEIPLLAAGGAQPTGSPVLLDAYPESQPSTKLLGCCSVVLLGPSGNLPLRLKVEANVSTLQKPGKYKLEIAVPDAQRKEPWPLELTLELRPAKLEVPSTLEAKVTRWAWPWSTPERPALLTLMERSGDSALSDLTYRVLDVEVPTGQAPADVLRLEEAATRLGVSASVPLHPAPATDLPLGETTGKLEIDARELAAPVAVPFTITTRYTPALLLVPLTLGLVAGFVLRIGLARRIERQTLALAAHELQQRMEGEVQRRGEADFKTEVGEIRKRIDEAIQRGDITELKKAIETEAASFNSASAALSEKEKRIRAELANLKSLVETRWQLPAVVAEKLSVAKAALPAVEAEVADWKLNEAETELGRIAQTLAGDAQRAARTWRQEHLDALSKLGAGAEASPALKVASTTVESDLSELRKALFDLDVSDAKPAAETLVESLHPAFERCIRFNDELLRTLRARLGSALDALAALPPREPDAVNAARDHVARLLEDADAAATDPTAVLGLVLARHQALSQSLSAAFEGQIQTEDEKHAVRALLEAGSLLEAARKVRELLEAKAAPAGDEILSGRREATPAEARPSPTPLPLPGFLRRVFAPVVRILARAEGAPVSPPAGAGELVARTWGELALLQLARTAVAALLLLVGGFFIWEPSFVGSWREHASIFLWAFGIDLTIDKAMEVAGPLGRKG